MSFYITEISPNDAYRNDEDLIGKRVELVDVKQDEGWWHGNVKNIPGRPNIYCFYEFKFTWEDY